MKAPSITFAILLTLLASSVSAQVSDVSDSLWSIIVPTAAAIDIAMGQVLVSDSRDSVVTAFLTNTGPVDISIEDIRFSGTDAGMFSLVSGIPPFDIAMGATREVEFRFSPSSVGVKTATIFVHTQIDTLTQSIRGEGVLPQIEVLADLVDFGAVLVGTMKDTVVTAVIRNSGGSTVAISGTGQLGPDMTQFSVLSGGGAFTLGAGESRTMQLRFAPTTPGRTSGRLGLYHDGVGSPAEVHLFGEGKTAPTAAAIDVDMGQVRVNEIRDSVVTAFLSNTGTGDITIEEIRFSGADAGMFSLVSGIPPFEIPEGETKAVEFRFSPTSEGMKTATIIVHTQIDTLTQSIRGEGVLPRIEVLADLVDFGAVLVGAMKDTVVAAVIRNSGVGTVAISGTGQLGPDMMQFSVLSGGGAFMLGAGESHTMQLRFAPTAPGRTSGRLGLYHDGVGSPAEVHLYGEGISLAGTATLGLDTIRARAGELVEIPVYLRAQQDLALTGATGFFAELRFNTTLLSPTGATPLGSITAGERIISLDNLPVQPDARGILARYSFIAMLGDAEGTPLHLENAFAVGGNVAVAEIPGYFLLTDVCREGGTRLFHQSGLAALRQNRPNPFNAATVIEYEVIENGPTRLHVMDLLGRTVAVLVDGIVEAGSYTIFFDASALSSGTYLYVLQTPTQRFHKLMEVVK